MDYRQLLSGDPRRRSMLYLGIGAVSLLKAIALRNDSTRFKRELLDAGLFIGIGLALRKYGTLRDEKRREIEGQLPNWVVDTGGQSGDSGGIRTMAKQRLRTEPEPEPSLGERAKNAIAGR
ncbi:hypothetical protein OB905_08415 [Halobacteria archaeon AArc-dxtr1]|nr:hypothetical protein [Halobacteria archaeon AArc-dxtr1]